MFKIFTVFSRLRAAEVKIRNLLEVNELRNGTIDRLAEKSGRRWAALVEITRTIDRTKAPNGTLRKVRRIAGEAL